MRLVQLFTDAQFWIGDGEAEWASNLLSIDGIIAATSEEDIARALESLSTQERAELETVSLGGAHAYPAFRDGHCHPLFAGRELQGVNVTDARSVPEIQSRLREHISQRPDDFWVDAAAFDRGLLLGEEHPRLILDAVSTEHGIVLHADDHHTLWVNSKALELAGILAEAPTLPEGEVSVDSEGLPNGVLREWSAMRLVMDQMPKPTIASDAIAWSDAQRQLLSLGIVEVQDAWIDPGMTNSYLALAESGALRIRVSLALRLDATTWRRDWDAFELDLQAVQSLGHENLHINAVKIFIDGAFGNQTAAVKQPYRDGGFGTINWSENELDAAIQRAERAGLQLHFHAIGDAAVSFTLAALRRQATTIAAVIAHAELIDPADFAAIRDLGATLQFQPLWARRDSMLNSCADALGEGRVERLYAISTALSMGVPVAFGSDWPVSNPSPLAGIAVAATRQNAAEPSALPLNANESIAVADAWRAYSAGVSQQLHFAPHRGQLRPGQAADFITLAVNVFEVAPLSLGDLKVDSVYIAANRVQTT